MENKKLFITKKGFIINDVDDPIIGINDVLIDIQSSFYSKGTEGAVLKKASQGLLKKSINFRKQISQYLKELDFKNLYEKFKSHQNLSLESGYSIFGRVVGVGVNVSNLRSGQYVVCLGPKSSHGSFAVVPQGLCFPVEYNLNFSSVALVSIALNSVIVETFCLIQKY